MTSNETSLDKQEVQEYIPKDEEINQSLAHA